MRGDERLMPDDPTDPNLLEALEAWRNFAALATGIRTDMIANGWSEEGAEQVALELFRKALRS
jgi:hypothetical protein